MCSSQKVRPLLYVLVYGIDYESSITKGSQYRVEGILCRVTKKMDFLLLSASRDQVKYQEQMISVPFVQEPPKCIFYSPVVVLDFQSLYPSIMIAYNLCYATCLGKLRDNLDIDNSSRKEDFLMHDNESKK
jgi:DNA polymerase zeta